MSTWSKPPSTVTLVRMPSGIPALPPTPSPQDEGHRALSAASVIAQSPEKAHRIADDQRAPAQEAEPDLDEKARDMDAMWGGAEAADANAARIAGYLDALPEAQRQAIESDPRADDPAYLQEVLGQARMPRPAQMTEAGIERWMQTNRRDYERNEEVQRIYRDLIDERLAREGSQE